MGHFRRGAAAESRGLSPAPSGEDSADTAASPPAYLFVLLIGLVALAVSIGVALRLRVLGVGSLWLDELWTTDAVSRTFKEMIGARLVSDQSPPLWTTSVWAWVRLTGTYSASVLRTWPLVWGLIGIGAFILGGSLLPRLRATLMLTAAALALSLMAIQFSVELRPYSMSMALVSAATVIWAGLLTGQIPARGVWVFWFALAGALAGFAHYYGNLPYLAEATILVVWWFTTQRLRMAAIGAAWAGVSLVPVIAWIAATRRWFPDLAVAPPPSFDTIRAWLVEVLQPIPRLIDPILDGWWSSDRLLVLLVLVSFATGCVQLMRARRSGDRRGAVEAFLTVAALTALVLAFAGAWIVSLIAPPSLNGRNAFIFLPLLLLGLAGAITAARRAWVRWAAASAAAAMLVAAMATAWFQWGTTELAPWWHREAGYAPAAQALLDIATEEATPLFLGLEAPWRWHGDWDAILRSLQGSGPADESDPAPLPVTWLGTPADFDARQLPEASPIVLFTAYDAERFEVVLAALEPSAGPCTVEQLGGPQFGVVHLAVCTGIGERATP